MLSSFTPVAILLTLVYVVTIGISSVEGQTNYFGVAYSPYVRRNALYDSYTIGEIKQMLKILLTNHNLLSTYSSGTEAYNKGKPWDKCDSNALIARAAAQVNKERNSVVLSVSQGIYQRADQQREIDNAFSAAADANSIYRGTVWGLVFTNEFVTDGSNGPRVLNMIRSSKGRAKSSGLKVGTRVHTCNQIIEGGPVQNILKQIAKESDFIMCNMYPEPGASNPEASAQKIGDFFLKIREAFKRENRNIEVQIGETGWASEGRTFNNAVNNVNNMKRFWNAMKSWASQKRVRVHMFEAFDEPGKDISQGEGERHFGWWYRQDNSQKYVEKSTNKVF